MVVLQSLLTCPVFGSEPSAPVNDSLRQVEFTQPLPLLASEGNLSAWGWSRRALMEYNREAIAPRLRGRIKEWEHYTVMSPAFTAGFTMARIGFIEFASVELIDYVKGTNRSAMILRVEREDRTPLPGTPYGNTAFTLGESILSYSVADGKRRLHFNFAKTPLNPAFRGEVELIDDPAEESIAITRPFAEPGHFFYENKIFAMPATGSIQVEEDVYALPSGKSFAIFDWGRGIWPRDSSWYWGQGAGMTDGKRVGFNLGHGYGDDARGTCNAILVDGVIHKLGHVAWDEPPTSAKNPRNDATSSAAAWHVHGDDGRIDLMFQPTYTQHVKQNLGVAAAELNKIHGTFSGILVTDDGTKIDIKDFVGFLEHMTQRW